MKTNEIMKSLDGTIRKVGFQLQKKSPEILVATGVIGVVASAVLACKATTKAGRIIEETEDTLSTIHEASENGITSAGETYSDADYQKDMTIAYVQAGVKFVKLYGPSVALGTLSIASILASHHIMRKRNIAIAAGYAALDKRFKEYRSRVMDRFGEQVEKELRYGIKAQEIENTVVDEKGKEKTVKETVDVVEDGWDPTKYSIYAKIFDEGHPAWMKDPEQNLFYLRALQSQANDMLRARGHLFLNEVYDLLGFERTKAGAIVGWVYDNKNPVGDNYVDFGIYDVWHPKTSDFVNGYERSIILDFNVAGDILDEIASHQNL